MSKPITLQWKNTSTDRSPTGTSIQRCSKVSFNHPLAHIEVVAHGNKKGLDPLKENGWWIDDNVESNTPYMYRVITHREDEKTASPATNFIHCIDHDNDIGYPGGIPTCCKTYNIDISPVIHIDANRLTDVDNTRNSVIVDAQSLLRHNKIIECINTTGDPIVDLHVNNNQSQNIVCKTATSISSVNYTRDIKKSQLTYNLNDNYNFDNYTIFSVIYNGYNTDDDNNEYNLTTNGCIKWDNQKISIQLPSGNKTISRHVDNLYQVVCLKSSPEQTSVWENGRLLYNKKHIKNKNKLDITSKNNINILPNHNKSVNSGLCEYIMFNTSLNDQNLNIVSQYIHNKYYISAGNIDTQNMS